MNPSSALGMIKNYVKWETKLSGVAAVTVELNWWARTLTRVQSSGNFTKLMDRKAAPE